MECPNRTAWYDLGLYEGGYEIAVHRVALPILEEYVHPENRLIRLVTERVPALPRLISPENAMWGFGSVITQAPTLNGDWTINRIPYPVFSRDEEGQRLLKAVQWSLWVLLKALWSEPEEADTSAPLQLVRIEEMLLGFFGSGIGLTLSRQLVRWLLTQPDTYSRSDVEQAMGTAHQAFFGPSEQPPFFFRASKADKMICFLHTDMGGRWLTGECSSGEEGYSMSTHNSTGDSESFEYLAGIARLCMACRADGY